MCGLQHVEFRQRQMNEDEKVRCLERVSHNRSWTAAGNSTPDRWHFVAPCILNSAQVSVCHLTASADTRTCTLIEITTNDWSAPCMDQAISSISIQQNTQYTTLMESSMMPRELQHNTGNGVQSFFIMIEPLVVSRSIQSLVNTQPYRLTSNFIR